LLLLLLLLLPGRYYDITAPHKLLVAGANPSQLFPTLPLLPIAIVVSYYCVTNAGKFVPHMSNMRRISA
jgi:hypothetical protein